MTTTLAPEYQQLVTDLSAVVGSRYVLWRPEELMLYEYDGSALDMARPDIVVVPSSTAEVAQVVRIAAQAGFPVVARGGGTGDLYLPLADGLELQP